MLTNYLKIAWRNLLRNKLYSCINIGGLALGLAVVKLVLPYLNRMIDRTLDFAIFTDPTLLLTVQVPCSLAYCQDFTRLRSCQRLRRPRS